MGTSAERVGTGRASKGGAGRFRRGLLPVLSVAAVSAFAVAPSAGAASGAVPCVDLLTAHLTVAAPGQAVAGTAIAVTVTAETALGRPDPTFSCTVHLTSSDPKAELPSDHTFTTGPGGDDGTHTFDGVTFATPGSQTITAADTTSPSKAGTSSPVAVSSPPPSGLAFTTAPVSGLAGDTPTLGPLTVEFQDASGKPDPVGSAATVALSSTSTGAEFSSYSAGSGCGTQPTTTVPVPAGSSSASFCYGDPTAGSPTVSAVSGSLRATQQESIRADVGAISGTVTDSGSPPQDLSGICVNVQPASGGGPGGSSVTATDGTYTVSGLAPGSYDVEFSGCGSGGGYATQWYKGADSQATATPVPVTAGQTTTGVNAVMAAAAEISGTVTDASSPQQGLGGICVVAFPSPGPGSSYSAVTASNGTYAMNGLPSGSYTVEFYDCGNQGSYVTQWYKGASTQASATPVSVTAGQPTTGIDAAMAPGGSISGTVTDTASPPDDLANICVNAVPAQGGGPGGAGAVTAADGTYTINNLAPGSYDVQFFGCQSSSDYLTQWYQGASTQASAAPVSVTADQTTTGIDAAMAHAGKITGTVTDTSSPPTPITGICVSTAPVPGQASYGYSQVRTASDGTYTLTGLSTGSYDVEFSSCQSSDNYLTQWYKGASSQSSATPVPVTAGQTTTGIDAAMTPGGKITGTVTDSASPGSGLGGICVSANGSSGYGSAPTAPDGTYTLANLPAGSYTVEFSNGCGDSGSYVAQWYKGASSYWSATPVAVTAGQVTSGIDAAMVAGGTISGTVTDTATPPDPLSSICVYATPTSGNSPGSGNAVSAADGTYSIKGLAPGSYDVQFSDCGQRRYLTQWYHGASSQAAATAVTLTSGQTASGIDAAMVLGGTISGTVTDSSSPPNPLSGICVYAEPTQPSGAWSGYLTTAPDGTYTISGLPSGTYDIVFTDCRQPRQYLTQWYKGASSFSSATPVPVTAGQSTTGIDAAMVLGGVISGTVDDTSSPPQGLAGMCVSVTPVSGGGGGGFATTTSDGTYSVTGLPTGSYDVEFYRGCPNRGNYLSQWYQGAAARSSATAVPVTAGQTTSGIDAAMAPGGIISGTVRDSSSPSNPLSGICVAVMSTSVGGAGGSASTAADGTYTIDALPTGSYTVQFTTGCPNSANYASQWYQGATSQAAATAVPVTAGQTTSGIDAAMAPGGIISGTVTDTASPPNDLAGICVDVASTSAGSPGPFGWIGYTASTASDGTYSITRLPAGSYYVRFWNCGPPGTNYAPQWYQDASSRDTATAVSVSAGQTTSGIDAAMAPGGIISGTVTDTASPSNPLGRICVIATPTSTATGVSGGSGSTASDGTYSIVNLAAGSYTVEFRNCGGPGTNYASQWYDGASSPASSTPVSVRTGQTTSGIDAAMAPGGIISGTVTDSASPPNDLSGVCVVAIPSGSASSGGWSEWTASTASDGTYSIVNLPTGSYDVEFIGCGSGQYATQWYQGASSQSGATPVSVTAGQTSPGVNAAMTS